MIELTKFRNYLISEEKSEATVEKYTRDVKTFIEFLRAKGIVNIADADKKTLIAYKQHLVGLGYAPRSINSMLASLNSFLSFSGIGQLKVKSLKIQQQIFCTEEKELTRSEYERLCRAAESKGNIRLSLIIQTICSTGIRVSELGFITMEAVKSGRTTVSLKGKTRTVFMPKELRKKLSAYAEKEGIITGAIFVSASGRPVSRTTVWREMKGICGEAGVDSKKVFPHNLRHLFARIFYELEKDIAKLADILGHSSINTTRLYIISTGSEHRRRIERMGLII